MNVNRQRVGLDGYSTKCLRDYLDGTKSDNFGCYRALHGTEKVNQLENGIGQMKSGGCRRRVCWDSLTVCVCTIRRDNPLDNGVVSEFLRMTRNKTTRSDEPVSNVSQKS